MLNPVSRINNPNSKPPPPEPFSSSSSSIQLPMLGSLQVLQTNNQQQQVQQQQQPQQQQPGSQNNNIPLPPPLNGQDFTLSSVLHFLQTEWRRYERDRNEWEIERAEMRVRRLVLPSRSQKHADAEILLGSHRAAGGRAPLVRKCKTGPHAPHQNARICSEDGAVCTHTRPNASLVSFTLFFKARNNYRNPSHNRYFRLSSVCFRNGMMPRVTKKGAAAAHRVVKVPPHHHVPPLTGYLTRATFRYALAFRRAYIEWCSGSEFHTTKFMELDQRTVSQYNGSADKTTPRARSQK